MADVSAIGPLWIKVRKRTDKEFIIWYVIIARNTKSSINATSIPTKLTVLAELTS